MSVQAGIWNFDGRPVGSGLIASFSESLKRQGPDGEYTYVGGPIALLYRPFHTTAESRRENQPYVSRRRFIITWDGRLDNREELIADLRSDLETNPTDVAIVAAAFDRWETEGFKRIIGDWALSVWKSDLRELVFAVDYMAIRHIFYYCKQNQIWWSTDLSPLVLLSGDNFHIDERYIAGYFANEPDAHLTPYREIREVPPGQYVCIRNNKIEVQRFWRFSPQSRTRYKNDGEYEEHFRRLFRQSVRRRLRSDAPILAELSGGLDSSSIVCMADDIIANEGAQFRCPDTISYYNNAEPNGDDAKYFPKVEQKRGRVGVHLDGSQLGNSQSSLRCPEFYPLPGALGMGLELRDERADVIRRGSYRVVLSGIGGDDFLGGVPDPRTHLADLIVQFNVIGLARQLTAWSLVKRTPLIRLLWQSAIEILPASLGRYLVKEAKVEPWIRKDFAKRNKISIRQLDVDEHFRLWLPTRRSYIGSVQMMGCKVAKLLAPLSALEEGRYPYLDQHLIEFILSIPAGQLMRPGERRSLMRRSLAGIVPEEILARRTKQLGRRTAVQILEKHWPELEDVFRTAFLSAAYGYVDEGQIWAAIRDACAGKSVTFTRLLLTISLEYWLRDLAVRGLIEFPPAFEGKQVIMRVATASN